MLKFNGMYKIGFSVKEFNQIIGKDPSGEEIEKLLQEKGFEYKKVKVEDALRNATPECMNAVYKNPSSMREDAPGAFSCSSLISYLYTQAGVWMPSLSIDKYVFGQPVEKEDLKFGDLVFSNTGNGQIRYATVEWQPGTPVPEGVDHVGLYLDDGRVLHATKRSGGVTIETLEEFANYQKIVGYRRMADISEDRFVILIPDSQLDLRKKESFAAFLTS